MDIYLFCYSFFFSRMIIIDRHARYGSFTSYSSRHIGLSSFKRKKIKIENYMVHKSEYSGDSKTISTKPYYEMLSCTFLISFAPLASRLMFFVFFLFCWIINKKFLLFFFFFFYFACPAIYFNVLFFCLFRWLLHTKYEKKKKNMCTKHSHDNTQCAIDGSSNKNNNNNNKKPNRRNSR